MKIFKHLLFFSAISLVSFTSCRKNDDNPFVPKDLTELHAPDNFTWSTENQVELKITGLPTTIPVQSTLIVSLSDSTVLFSMLHMMDQNLTIKLLVPSTETKLILKYGSIFYPVNIINKQVSFSFIPVVTD